MHRDSHALTFISSYQELIGWKDPYNSYDYHNLIFDVPWEGMPRQKASAKGGSAERKDGVGPDRRETPLFSIIKHVSKASANRHLPLILHVLS